MGLKYTKATDSEHEIKLTPQLIYAGWRTAVARVGRAVPLEVLTSFVGNGAKIKIKGKSESGKKLGNVSGLIFNNKYVGELEIPDGVEIGDLVYFEVDLSGNSLKGESNKIPAAPPIDVTNMKWDPTEAHRKDIIKLKADVSGCQDNADAKITILEYDADGIHDKTADLTAVVKDNKIEAAWEFEYHDDADEIPTKEEMEKYGKDYNPPEYFFIIEIDGQKFGREQESGLLTFKDNIEIELVNQSGEAIPKEKYTLILADGSKRDGELDDTGKAVENDVPPGSCKIEFPEL